jgi:Ca2+-binding EF-hand superfamily protein
VTSLVKEMTGISSEAEIYKLLSEVDTNKNGFIERDEFLILMAR